MKAKPSEAEQGGVELFESGENTGIAASCRDISPYCLVKISSDERVLVGYSPAASGGDEGVHM
jgi:hypothetical protein